MLAKRIIPCLDVTNGRVVKGTNFIELRDAGDPVQLGQEYDRQGADELVFLDITASSDNRAITLQMVEQVADTVFIPFTVGGGINDIETIRTLLKAGADKVSLNTAAVKNPLFVQEAAKVFGSQCIVVAIDAKRIENAIDTKVSMSTKNIDTALILNSDSKFEVVTHGGRNRTAIDALKWAKKVESLGAGEILLTSMDADGTKDGYDLSLTKAISDITNIPVIASGGAGDLSHIGDVLAVSDAALLASLLHYKELTIKEIKNYLDKEGICVRK